MKPLQFRPAFVPRPLAGRRARVGSAGCTKRGGAAPPLLAGLLETKIETIKADILNRVFGLILGTLVVNIVAIVGAMFAVAKLLGH
jgi:hypothetical protein